MSSLDGIDDDYVARLLAEDAKQTSQKYASQGLSAFLPKRQASDLPKPNTRFLSHIVREADNHNAALKRKEEAEASRRLRALRKSEEEREEGPARKRRRADEGDTSKRNRLLKDILGAARSERTGRPGGSNSGSLDTRDRVRENDVKEDKRHEHKHKHRRKHRHGHTHEKRSRSPSPTRVRHSRTDRSYRNGRNSGSPSVSNRDTSPKKATSRMHHHSEVEDEEIHGRRDSNTETNAIGKTVKEDIHIRGRGAYRTRSAMDDHFAQNYDPSQDVSLESDHNDDKEDWDLALEAMRDRIKYKQNQTARMREAGFDEKAISKWEKRVLDEREIESDVRNVKWSRKGEVREWDAGKVEEA